MTDVDRTSRPGDRPPSEADLLLCRLTDGEADAADRERFEQLAAGDPALWRRLAAQQQEMALLSRALEQELASAMAVELPCDPAEVVIGRVDGRPAGHSADGVMRGAGASVAWLAAMVGWAAVLVLSVVLAISTAPQGSPASTDGTPVGNGAATPRSFTPEELWRLYLQAPFVTEELAPMVRESEALPDGGIRLFVIRRIEEIYDLTPEQAADLLEGLDAIVGGEVRAQQEQLDAIRRAIQQQQSDEPSQD